MKRNDLLHLLPQAKERRNSSRLKVNPLVYLNIAPDNGGFLLDLGEGGMCVSVASPLVLSAEIQFSFALGEGRPVRGAGLVRWLSESRKTAGVQFVRLQADSLGRIRKWLGVEEAPAQKSIAPKPAVEMEPRSPRERSEGDLTRPLTMPQNASSSARTVTTAPSRTEAVTHSVTPVIERKPPSAFTLFAPPPARPAAMRSEEPEPNRPPREGSIRPAMQASSLMFLPPNRQSEHDPLFLPSDPPSISEEKTTEEIHVHAGEEPTASRLQTGRDPLPAHRSGRAQRQLTKLLLGGILCATFLAAAIVIRSYPEGFSQLSSVNPAVMIRRYYGSFPWSWLPAPAAKPLAAAAPVARKIAVRRLKPKIRKSRPYADAEHSGRPIRDATIFYSPRQAALESPTDAAASPQNSQLTSLNQDPSIGEEASPISANSLGSLSANPANRPAKPSTSVSPMVSSFKLEGMMGTLRNDQALVEEGAPVTLSMREAANPGTVPKPIVVEAVIGKDGAVKDVRLISSPDSRLAGAVVAALKRWRYRPLYESGKPVEFTTRITFQFSTLPDKQ
jgi:TonB family protein